MKITSIRFGRTVSKNYQSQHVEYEATISDGESHEEALRKPKAIVGHALGEGPSLADVERAQATIAAAKLIGEALEEASS